MMWLHFLHRILKTFPRTLSSEIEYFVPHESQTIFINASFQRGNRSLEKPSRGVQTHDRLGRLIIILRAEIGASVRCAVSRTIPRDSELLERPCPVTLRSRQRSGAGSGGVERVPVDDGLGACRTEGLGPDRDPRERAQAL